MSDNTKCPLHIVVDNVNGDGELILKKAGSFIVSLKEYEGIQHRIEQIDKETKVLIADYDKRAATKAKKIDTTPKGNEKQRLIVAVTEDCKAIQKKVDALNAKKREIETERNKIFNDVRYVWQLVGNSLNLTKNSFNESLGKGFKKSFGLTFPEFLEGGGKAYLEAYHEGLYPMQKPPFGIYVSATGVPGVIRTIWTDCNCKEIKGTVAVGSTVLLHIYTKAMYGQELGIEFWDRDIFTPNDRLSIDNKTGEVNIHKLNEVIEVGLKGYSGTLEKDKQDMQDNISEGERVIQKAILQVEVSDQWIKDGGTELKVYPLVTCASIRNFFDKFERTYLHVSKDSKALYKKPWTDNLSPAKTGQVETNIGAFQPCRFDKVIGKYSKGNDTKGAQIIETILYDSKNLFIPKDLIMPVIAGPREARREVTIKLDSNTDECRYKGEPQDHTGKVINLTGIKSPIVIIGKMGETKVTDSNDDKFIIGNVKLEKEAEGHQDTDDDNENEGTHVNTSHSGTVGTIKVNQSTKRKNPQEQLILQKSPMSDKEVLLDIRYDYGKENFGTLLEEYIWPLRQDIIQHYPVILETCCIERKELDIAVYPDIKWVLQFAYDCDPEIFKTMRNETYDKYKLRVQELDEKHKPKTLKEKSDSIDNDLEQAKKNYEEAETPKEKKKFDRQVKKITYDKSKNDQRKAKYNNAKKSAKNDFKKNGQDLFSFNDNIAAGVSDLIGSLWVEYDRPSEAIEISGSYQRFKATVEQLMIAKNTIETLLLGTKKEKEKLEKERKEKDAALELEKMEQMKKALKGRQLVDVNMIPPSFAVVASWYAEEPKELHNGQIGIVGEIEVKAAPFIGAEMVFDFLGLIQRAHPIARGIVTIIDIAAAATGAEIRLDLIVTGSISCSGKLRYNSASKTTNFNEKALAADPEDDSPFTVAGTIDVSIVGFVKFSNKFQSFIIGSVIIYAEASFSVVTGITLSGALKADNEKGFYVEPWLTFHGVVLKAVLKGGAKTETKQEDQDAATQTGGGEVHTDVNKVLMEPYEGSFEDNGTPVRWYF